MAKKTYKVLVWLVAGQMTLDVEMDSPNTGGQIEAATQKVIDALLSDPEKTIGLFNVCQRENGMVVYDLVVRDVSPVQE